MFVRIIGGHGGVGPGFRATSYLIDGKLLLDAGSVASGLLSEEQTQIDNILISHPHLDHIAELAYLCDSCFGLKGKPFEVFANGPVIESIQKHLMNDLIWPDFSVLPTAEAPTIRFNTIDPERPLVIGEYKVLPVPVNHQGGACGFIVEKDNKAILFTQDTGPTEKIWKYAHANKNLKAIFTEVSFPNGLQKVATDSLHHTPNSIAEEIKKMPKDIPVILGHLKPNFQAQLYKEIEALNNKRITLLGQDDTVFNF